MSNDRARDDAPKPPSHIAYQVREGKEGEAYFNRVGAAFAHKDGKGYDVQLDAFPVGGRVTLRTPMERVQAARDGRREDGQDSRRQCGDRDR